MKQIRDYETIEELYHAQLDRRIKLDSKRKDAICLEENEQEQDTASDKPKFIHYLLTVFIYPFILFYKALIGTPDSSDSDLTHWLMGVFKTITYVFIMYNISEVRQLVEGFDFSDGVETIFLGCLAILMIFQVFIGVFTAALTFTGEPLEKIDSPVIIDGKYKFYKPDLQVKPKREEYDETMRYINAKMTGMSNRKKEKYLSDFYGGKIK